MNVFGFVDLAAATLIALSDFSISWLKICIAAVLLIKGIHSQL